MSQCFPLTLSAPPWKRQKALKMLPAFAYATSFFVTETSLYLKVILLCIWEMGKVPFNLKLRKC